MASQWRVGGKVPHHVYEQRGAEPDRRPWPDGDRPVGMFLDPGDARRAVGAVNALHALAGSPGTGTPSTATGHPLGDAVLPAALRLVGAVRDGAAKEITAALGAAYEAADGNPYWPTALILVLAGLVPDTARPSHLLAWNHEGAPE